uniref:Uncharacterized protein n=1 Tax=Tanacetum cinerariifolium TaxID=118510 RepID=A0A6L2MUE2_TANCI|nr:hypothetical protein [Tanacetum cinerariifolium]
MGVSTVVCSGTAGESLVVGNLVASLVKSLKSKLSHTSSILTKSSILMLELLLGLQNILLESSLSLADPRGERNIGIGYYRKGQNRSQNRTKSRANGKRKKVQGLFGKSCQNSLKDRIICDLNKTPDLFQEPSQNCAKCGNPVDGHYCQGCALLRKKFKEDMFTYCTENGIFQYFQDTSESSNDNTNVVNALQEPFVIKQDPGENSSQSAHYGYNYPPKVPVVSNPEPCHNQNVDELPLTLTSFHPTCYSGDEDSFVLESTSNIVHDSPNFPIIHQPIREKTCAELLAEEQEANFNTQPFQYSVVHQPPREEISETILEIELAFEEKHCQPNDILELFQRLHNDVQNIHEELAVYINTLSWDHPTICYNDDDDDDCTIAIKPILSTEETDNSLRIGDEHLDTIPVTESEELIKSSVENLVPTPSESEGIPDNMCDVPFLDNSSPLDVSKDQFEDFSDSNDDSTSIDDDSFSINGIEYVKVSPPDSELASLKVMEIVIPEEGGIDANILLTIKDDTLHEKLLNINLLIANIEALKDNPTPYSDQVFLHFS